MKFVVYISLSLLLLTLHVGPARSLHKYLWNLQPLNDVGGAEGSGSNAEELDGFSKNKIPNLEIISPEHESSGHSPVQPNETVHATQPEADTTAAVTVKEVDPVPCELDTDGLHRDSTSLEKLIANVKRRQLHCVEELVRNEKFEKADLNNVLLEAAKIGNEQTLMVLLDHGADVNYHCVNSSETALHYAAQDGHLPSVQLLLSRGADVETKDQFFGYTPLYLAAFYDHTECVKVLLDHGANVNARSKHDVTPLHYAARGNSAHSVHQLLAKGALLEAQEEEGRTPLHSSAATAQKGDAALRVLVGFGANINATDRFGRTPLHVAGKFGNEHAVNTLVQRGANVNAKDNSGNTPLHLAAENGKLESVEALLGRGAYIDSTNHDGRTPLELAKEKDHIIVVEYLSERGARH